MPSARGRGRGLGTQGSTWPRYPPHGRPMHSPGGLPGTQGQRGQDAGGGLPGLEGSLAGAGVGGPSGKDPPSPGHRALLLQTDPLLLLRPCSAPRFPYPPSNSGGLRGRGPLPCALTPKRAPPSRMRVLQDEGALPAGAGGGGAGGPSGRGGGRGGAIREGRGRR